MEWVEGKQTLDVRIYLIVSVGIKPSLVHVVKALNKMNASRSLSLFRDNNLDLPQKIGHKGSRQVPWSPWCPFPLRNFSTKKEGLHIPRTRSLHRSTPSWRIENLSASLQDSKGQAHQEYSYAHKALSLSLSHTHTHSFSRANLELTPSKLVLRSKDVIKWHFGGLKVFFNVYVSRWVSTASRDSRELLFRD
jgi:hypothetical protein